MECSANFVLAPAMSETLMPFGGPVAQLVASRQAIVAVANNPAEWLDPGGVGSPDRPARAMFGHPGFVRQTRIVQSADATPGVSLLQVGSGSVKWSEAAGQVRTSPRSRDRSPVPNWATALQRRWAGNSAEPTSLVPRHAAVLVLLTGNTAELSVLLTRRSVELTNYPGKWAFPGGSMEPEDDNLVQTALREAQEEIGLDPSTVEVDCTLPALTLTETGFVVTPVVAWSQTPAFTHGVNPGEVTAVEIVPLRSLVGDPTTLHHGATRISFRHLGLMTAAVMSVVRTEIANANAATSG